MLAVIWGCEVTAKTVKIGKTIKYNPPPQGQSRFLGRGCDEALFSEKKGLSVKRGEAIQ